MKSVAARTNGLEDGIEAIEQVRTLMGGTKAMRAASTRYLPKEKNEAPEEYKSRLDRSFLFNGFKRTVCDMADKVFAKPIQVGEDAPVEVRGEYGADGKVITPGWQEDIDLTGRHLNNFAYDVMKDGLQAGINYLFVDMPASPAADGVRVTKADEMSPGFRPYLNLIKKDDMLGWKTGSRNGKNTLIQVRFKEMASEPKDGDEFAEEEIEQIRVLDHEEGGRITWRVFREAKDKAGKASGNWELHSNGAFGLIDEIPLVPVYFNRTAFMMGQSPLDELSDLNVAHWQSSSDQRNILHVARVPFLFGAGFPVDENGNITVSVSRFTTVSDPSATLGWVEHSGAAISSGNEDLKNLEFQMQVFGLQLLIPKPGGQTATGEAIDQAKMNSPLAMMADNMKDALEAAIGLMVKMKGKKEDAGGSLTINKDFGVSMRDAADLNTLLSAVNAGQISRETFWKELIRRGVLADDFDADEEAERIEEEAPDLGMIDPPEDDLGAA